MVISPPSWEFPQSGQCRIQGPGAGNASSRVEGQERDSKSGLRIPAVPSAGCVTSDKPLGLSSLIHLSVKDDDDLGM